MPRRKGSSSTDIVESQTTTETLSTITGTKMRAPVSTDSMDSVVDDLPGTSVRSIPGSTDDIVTGESLASVSEIDELRQKVIELQRKLDQEVEINRQLRQESRPLVAGCTIEVGQLPECHIIQRHYTFLLKELDPYLICIHLFEVGVFDINDKCKIESLNVRVEKCDKLLMLLWYRGPRAFGKFLDVLTKTGHDKVRDVLEADVTTENSNDAQGYFSVEVKLNIRYDPEYQNQNSEKFQKLAMEIENAVDSVFRDNGYRHPKTTVISIKPGSVIVTYVFTTYTQTDADNFIPVLSKVLASGFIGPYKVSTDQLSVHAIGEWLTKREIPDETAVQHDNHGDGIKIPNDMTVSPKEYTCDMEVNHEEDTCDVEVNHEENACDLEVNHENHDEDATTEQTGNSKKSIRRNGRKRTARHKTQESQEKYRDKTIEELSVDEQQQMLIV